MAQEYTRNCRRCGILFTASGTGAHGQVYCSAECRQSNEARTNWQLDVNSKVKKYCQRRRMVLNLVKTTAGCMDCCYDENPVALDFDHVDGTKVKSVGRMTSYSYEKIWEEVMKCDVVCANCHRIRTQERNESHV